MDHCLRIPEVVDYICLVLDGRDAVSMGLVHKAFLEPALDSLWRQIDSFKPLVSCLPSDLLTVEVRRDSWSSIKGPLRVHFLQRPLKASDLQRYIAFYAGRIRSFKPTRSDCRVWLSVEVMQSMQIATNWVPGALTPRLEHLEWVAPLYLGETFGEDVATHFPVCMSLFFGPTVTSTHIQMDLHDHLYQSVLEAASKQLHHRLKKLHIAVDDLPEGGLAEDEILPSIHDYVTCANWPNLEELRVNGLFVSPYLNSKTVQHLGTLSRLTNIKLDDFEYLPSLCIPAGTDVGGTFPSLRNVKLSSTSLPGIIHFLEHFSPSSRIATLECTTYARTSIGDIQRCIDTIGSRLNPHTLRELALKANPFADGADSIVVHPDPDGTLDISPILAFNNLIKLEVCTSADIRLTPALVEGFPAAWRNIQHLNLFTSYPSTRIPSIDHTHFLSLLERAPYLTFLGLRFDCSQISGDERSPKAPFNLNRLIVGDAPIFSPTRVFAFLGNNISLKPGGANPYQVDHGMGVGLEWSVPSYMVRWKTLMNSL